MPQPKNDTAGLSQVKNLIAVASGKGGVAKSTTAVNLAAALHQAGRAVGILDADIYGPSLPTMLSVQQEPQIGDDQRIVPALASGMKLVSMGFFVPRGKAAILRGPLVSSYVTQLLTNVEWGALDYLIIDYPPGTGDVQLTLSQQAPITGAVITTTPQEIAVIDARKAIVMFDTTHIPVVGVVETMSYFICDGCDKRHEIFPGGGGARVAEETGVPFLGQVPLDPAVAAGGDEGRPIIAARPESPVAQAYVQIAAALDEQLAILQRERGSYLETFTLEWDQSR